MNWDFFISHASEDKADIARPLADMLQAKGYNVWYDEYTLTLGDNLRRSIEHGLAHSRYVIVVLSPSFFAKKWTNLELDGLVALEKPGEKRILPVWHNVSAADVERFSSFVAMRLGVTTSEGLNHVVAMIEAAATQGRGVPEDRVMNTDTQRYLSRCLDYFPLDAKELERLIAAIYRRSYPDLQQMAPEGGVDTGIDLFCLTEDGAAIIWCITTEKDAARKLTRDALTVLRTYDQWRFRAVSKMYLCSCRKVTPPKWQTLRQKVLAERDRLQDEGRKGLETLELVKSDCDDLACHLCEPDLASYGTAILARFASLPRIPSIEQLSAAQTASPSDMGEDLPDIEDEWSDARDDWSHLLKAICTTYPGVEESDNAPMRLAAVDEVLRFVDATRRMGFATMEEKLPHIQSAINEALWPKAYSALSQGVPLSASDYHLSACMVYANLVFSCRSSLLSANVLNSANGFLIATARAGTLWGHIVQYRLITFLLWLNRRFHLFPANRRLIDAIMPHLGTINCDRIAHEDRLLLLNVALLYVQTLKYGEGDREYRQSLGGAFRIAMDASGDSFWRTALLLLEPLYQCRSANDWARTRDLFVQGFERLRMDFVKTVPQAILYMELHARYLELTEAEPWKVCEEKHRVVSRLKACTNKDLRLELRRLWIELSAARVCPRSHVAGRFRALEGLVPRLSSRLGKTRALAVRLRMLAVFLFRVVDPNVLRDEEFCASSRILSRLLKNDWGPWLERYFGVTAPDGLTTVEAAPGREFTADAFNRLREPCRQLLNRALRAYTLLLSHVSQSPDILARITLDYCDFLNYAQGQQPTVEATFLFDELLATLEGNANTILAFHGYLARFYRGQFRRDVRMALRHFDAFWTGAADLAKNRMCAEYAKTLYEHYLYFEEDADRDTSLSTLLDIGQGFLATGSRKHLVACYYGLGLVMKGEQRGENEKSFLSELGTRLLEFDSTDHKDGRSDEDSLLNRTVYTTRFREFLVASEGSYIAGGLLASLGSPEVYNDIATFLLQGARRRQSSEEMKRVRILYDIAIGLAEHTEAFVAKYRFNRIRSDFIEIQWRGPPGNDEDAEHLIGVIDTLHRLRGQFVWAYRFLKEDVCGYICAHWDEPGIRRVIAHDHFRRYWGTLRSAIERARHGT